MRFDKLTTKFQQAINDGGKSWDDAKFIFTTKSKSDHPQLINSKNKVYLSVNTISDGYKLVEMTDLAAK